jgi:Ni/Co efflux regulator RcnB
MSGQFRQGSDAMLKTGLGAARLLAFLVAGALLSGPLFAKKDDSADTGAKGQGHAKGKKNKQKHFSAEHRDVARDYYVQEYRQSGKCPPGLAKKNNGCLPPGQAKKWSVGQPLPKDVVLYEVPPQLVVKIGPPPAGYKYVRVAADILLIAAGTRMVVDAISDLSRL